MVFKRKIWIAGIDPAPEKDTGIGLIHKNQVVKWSSKIIKHIWEAIDELADLCRTVEVEPVTLKEGGVDSIEVAIEDWQYHKNPYIFADMKQAQKLWIDAAEYWGMTWCKVELRKWRRAWSLPLDWNLGLDLKQAAVDTVRKVYGVEVEADAAEAILLADWWQRERTMAEYINEADRRIAAAHNQQRKKSRPVLPASFRRGHRRRRR